NPHWAMIDVSSTTDNTSTGVLGQFAFSIQYVLQKLGLAISNGIATLKEIIVDTVTSKKVVTDQLCVGTTCVNESQLQQLLSGSKANTNTNTSDTTTPTSPVVTAPSLPPNITMGGALGISFVSPSTGENISGTAEFDVS